MSVHAPLETTDLTPLFEKAFERRNGWDAERRDEWDHVGLFQLGESLLEVVAGSRVSWDDHSEYWLQLVKQLHTVGIVHSILPIGFFDETCREAVETTLAEAGVVAAYFTDYSAELYRVDGSKLEAWLGFDLSDLLDCERFSLWDLFNATVNEPS